MEKLSKEELFARRLMTEAGLERPSSAFAANVMSAIAEKKTAKAYKPLLPPGVWVVVGAVIGASVLALYVLNSYPTLTIDFSFLDVLTMPKMELSRTTTYAIAFISLFFLQIPFLKNVWERQYRM